MLTHGQLKYATCLKAYEFVNPGMDCLEGASLGSAYYKATLIKTMRY